MKIVISSLFLCLFILLLPSGSHGIKCYECYGEDSECTVGLLGEKRDCPPTTTSCYKSWTVETAPKTKRKCADERVYENACHDVLFGQNSMLACYCSDEDFCNSALIGTKPLSMIMMLLMAALISSML